MSVSTRKGTTTSASSGRQRTRPDQNARNKKPSAAEVESLKNVWAQIANASKGKSDVESKDLVKFLKNGGAQVDKDVLSEFVNKEIGKSVSEAAFLESCQRYFNEVNANASEECAELWQLIGAGQTSVTGEGRLQAKDLCAAMTKFGVSLTDEEAEDIVAYSSCGNDEMAYADFVRFLYP